MTPPPRSLHPFSLLALILVLPACTGSSREDRPPPPLRVAAASSLKFALEDLDAAFRHAHPGGRLQIAYASSGNLYAQLSNRAPFDLFLSADAAYPGKLAEAGLALEPPFSYARGRLVVWLPRTSPLDLERLGLRVLLEEPIRRIALANPRHAPYGRAAVAALRNLELYETLQTRLTYGENVAQAAQFVQSGAADAGLIALSLALTPGMREAGRFVGVPESAHPPVVQSGLLLRWAREPEVARSFRGFLLGPEGQAILEHYGFSPLGQGTGRKRGE